MVRSNINKWLYVCLAFCWRWCCCCCCCLFAIYCYFDIKTNKLHTPIDMANFKHKWKMLERMKQNKTKYCVSLVYFELDTSEIFHFLMGFVSMSGMACVVCWYGRFWQLFNFSHSVPLWLFPYFAISFCPKNPRAQNLSNARNLCRANTTQQTKQTKKMLQLIHPLSLSL